MKDWTPNFPTQPGWYWSRTPHGDERLFEVVRASHGIHRLDPQGNPIRPETEGLALRFERELDSATLDGWSWFGPVEPPSEADASIGDSTLCARLGGALELGEQQRPA